MCNISEGKDYFTQKIKFPQSRYRNWNSFAHAHLDTDQMYWGESLLWHTTGLQPTQQKHETFTQCWVKVGPIKINLTLGQRLVFAGYTPHETWWRSHVYWFCVETTCRMTYFRRHQTHENCTHVFVFVFFQPVPPPPPCSPFFRRVFISTTEEESDPDKTTDSYVTDCKCHIIEYLIGYIILKP